MAGIVLEITVDDKGTPVIKRLSDETKRAFDEMKKGTEQARGPLDSLKDSWVGITAKVAIATAAFYATKRMIYDTAKEIASATNDIGRQAAVIGINTDELQKWQFAAKMSDVNAEELAIGIKLLSRNMEDASSGSGDAAKYFSAMGISIKDTSGHLRPLNQVMGDIMDKFASWEDGPRKIAIAMQLFGRSGETLIPLLNKGKSGFNELAIEAQKLGIILDPSLISAGSKAEDIFKKLEAQSRATRLSFTPLVLEFAQAIESILRDYNRLNNFLKTNKTIDWFPQIGELNKWLKENSIENWREKLGIPSKQRVEQRDEEEQELMRGRTKTYTEITKIAPPEIGKEIDIVKEVQSAIDGLTSAEEERGIVALARHELIEDGWSKEEDIVKQIQDEIANLERTTNEWGEITVGRQELVEAGWDAIAKKEEEEIREGIENAKLLHQAWLESYTKTNEIGETLAKNMGQAWNFNIKNIITESKSMGDAIRNVFLGMADAFSSAVSKMISDWILFGSVTGQYKAGSGLLGWFGSLLGSSSGSSAAASGFSAGEMGQMTWLQHGADFWANKPMIIGVGEGGERERVTVTPESKMAGAGRSPISLNIANIIDSRQIGQFLASSAGQDVILNVMSSRAGTIKRILR